MVILQNSSTDEIVVKGHASSNINQAEPVISIEPSEVSLKPGATTQVVIHINVPDDVQTGHRLSAVLFDAASSGAREVSIVGQVGVAIGVDVIRPVSDVSWSIPRIVDSTDSVVFQMAGRNTGNFTTRLIGTAVISGIFGEGNARLQAASDPVAIGETATLQAIWEDAPLFAIKKVTLGLSSGIGAPIERKVYILIFPWKLILTLSSLLAVAALGVSFRPRLAKVFSRNWRKVG